MVSSELFVTEPGMLVRHCEVCLAKKLGCHLQGHRGGLSHQGVTVSTHGERGGGGGLFCFFSRGLTFHTLMKIWPTKRKRACLVF